MIFGFIMHLCKKLKRKRNFFKISIAKKYKSRIIDMFRGYFLMIVLVLVGIKAYSTDSDSSKSGFNVSEYQAEVRKIKSDADQIYQQFQIYELDVVEEKYQRLNDDVEKVEQILKELNNTEDINIRNEFFDLFEETLDSYNKLINLYDFYVQLERRKERWSNEYFNLWEQTYALKVRIDQLYVKEEKVNVHYGGMKDAEITKIRKRNIYESCNIIYDKTLSQLKRLNDCDHYGRIQLLQELIPVLDKCSKLAYLKNTKTLEKELKNTDDPKQKSELILDFESE